MKFIKKVLALILLIFSCFFIPQIRAAIPNLEINEGFYSETLLSNGMVDIWANPLPEGMIFDQWVGDSDLIDDTYSFHTRMEPPKTSSQINATYKPCLSNWDIKTNVTLEIFNGTEVYYYLPSNYKGIVFIFHGRGGSSVNWVSENRTETFNFMNRIVLREYGFIAFESIDRDEEAQWDGNTILENNTDIQNINYILLNFTNRGLIRSNCPLFGLGMSNGGGFISRASIFFNFSAQAIFCAGGISFLMQNYLIPTYWNLAVNDHFPNINPKGWNNYLYYISNGAFAELYMNQPTPVHPKQFSYINDISYENSSEIYDAFREAQIFDEFGYIYPNITSTDPLYEAIPEDYSFRNSTIVNSILGTGGYHTFYSKDIHNVLNFFDKHNDNKTEFALTSNVDNEGILFPHWSELDGKYHPPNYDDDGLFDLIWSESAEANNYSIYYSEDSITELSEDLICLAYQNATIPFAVNMSQVNGYRYFITVAHSESGDTPSDYIRIQIGEIQEIQGGEAAIPFGNLLILFTAMPIILTIIILRKKIKS